MQRVWSTVCGKSETSRYLRWNQSPDRQIVVGKVTIGRDQASDGGLRNVVTKLCQPQVCPGAASGSTPLEKKERLILQCDEMWSFVGRKRNKQWVWIALDADSREVVALVVGDRSQATAQTLWDALPQAYQDGAICYTDEWEAYAAVIPPDQHRPVKKDSGKTNYLERFNCTLRQRVSRLVRKTLSFSKKLTNHIGAIWYFVHYYNASLSFP